MTFHVGQEVACVDVSPNNMGRAPAELVKWRIYVVCGIDEDEDDDCDGDIGLFLSGVETVPDHRFSDSFKAWRFRPVIERKTDISIFTAMLNPSKQGVDA